MTNTTSYTKATYLPFHLADPAGIVFFGHVFALAHEAFEHFITDKLEFSWNFWFQNDEWAVPIKHTEASYFHPLLAGKSCLISLTAVNMTNCSFTTVYEITQSGIKNCEIKIVHVFIDKFTKSKTPIPEAIKLQLVNLPLAAASL